MLKACFSCSIVCLCWVLKFLMNSYRNTAFSQPDLHIFDMCMYWQDIGACWLHCCGPIHYASILNSGSGSVLTLTSRSWEGPRLQTTNVWAWSAVSQNPNSKYWHSPASKQWQSLVVMNLISSKPQVLRSWQPYKLLMPEREVVVCSADEGQQAWNSCPELPIFFSWHHYMGML